MVRCFVVGVLCSASAVQAQGAWEELKRDGSLCVEARPDSPGGYFEFRVTTRSDASPLELAEAVWQFDTNGVEGRMLERRLVVSEGPHERVVWSVVRPPLVSVRESLIRFTRVEREGAVQIVFESTEGAPPDAHKGGVRVTVRGLWSFEPDAAGGTRVEHRILSNPGGGLAPWLVKGTQQDLVTAVVRETVARAERAQPRAR